MLITFFILSLAIVHITTILSESFITEPIRNFIASRNGFIGYGVNCFFCTSTWVSQFIAFMFFLPTHGLLATIILGFALATVANTIKSLIPIE